MIHAHWLNMFIVEMNIIHGMSGRINKETMTCYVATGSWALNIMDKHAMSVT